MANTKRGGGAPSASVQKFDVAVIGSGFAGSIMAAILAKHGLKVVILDKNDHPYFSLGESTIGETSYMLKVLADRYGVPEIGHCSDVDGIQNNVGSSSGMKLNFGFVYHRKGQEHILDECTQCSVNSFPMGPENHLFRQDVDAYLFNTAISYGAVARPKTNITNVRVEADGVRIDTSDGDQFDVEYVVDGSGYDSVLAKQFNLRQNPPRFLTQSRALFTHMVNVPAFDTIIPRASGQPTPWGKGTLHHFFDGGWIWVIPFNNRKGSTNPLCSVGANLDPRVFPKPSNLTPQQEWDQLIAQFPTIQKHLGQGRPVRTWVSTDRLQYSSSQTVGDRWMLMSHAAGAVDALFSRGLANTLQVINSAAALLLKAFKDRKDFSAERFAYIDRMNQTCLDFNDKLVHGSYVAFRDFDLWRAWSKVWFLSWQMGFKRISGTLFDYLERRDPAIFSVFEKAKFPGSFCPDVPEFQTTFEDLHKLICEVESGEVSVKAAPAAFSKMFAHASFAPKPLNLWDVFRRFHDGTPWSLKKMYDWGSTSSPDIMRKYFRYNFKKMVSRYNKTLHTGKWDSLWQGGAK